MDNRLPRSRARSMDGFRRPQQPKKVPAKAAPVVEEPAPQVVAQDVAMSLPQIPAIRSLADHKPRVVGHRRARKWPRRVAAVFAVFVLAGAGFFGVKLAMAAHKVIAKNHGGGAPALAAAAIDPTKLKGEGDGRINILLLGIGGAGHDGPNLSDTMMVASIDPKTKDVAMMSIPRDLYVQIPGYGSTKINAANSLGGPELAEKVVSKVLDLQIHYYVVVDFSGFKQAVDAVGGVDILVKEALSDPSYPCDKNEGRACGYAQAAGSFHMNGTTALKYARCRKGNCGNDFGRAQRQQDVMVALRKKALEASTLTNPIKLSGLIDTVGDHLKTDMQISEMKKLALIIKDVDTNKMVSKVLDDSSDGLLMEGSSLVSGAGSILVPKAGLYDYSDIQELAHSIFVDGYLKQENASIQIQNGTSRSGLAATVQKMLAGYGYNMLPAKTADSQSYASTKIYDYTGGKKPYTINYLERRFGVKAQKATLPQGATGTQPNIAIILGADYRNANNATSSSSQ